MPDTIAYEDINYTVEDPVAIIEFNREAERLYGRKRANVLGKDYLELFVPDNARETAAANIDRVLAGENVRE